MAGMVMGRRLCHEQPNEWHRQPPNAPAESGDRFGRQSGRVVGTGDRAWYGRLLGGLLVAASAAATSSSTPAAATATAAGAAAVTASAAAVAAASSVAAAIAAT